MSMPISSIRRMAWLFVTARSEPAVAVAHTVNASLHNSVFMVLCSIEGEIGKLLTTSKERPLDRRAPATIAALPVPVLDGLTWLI